MKKIILILCFIAGIVSASHAQKKSITLTPAEQAGQLQAQLNLTDAQKAQITSIIAAQTASIENIGSSSGTNRQAMMEAMRAASESGKAKLKAVLTGDQAAAYDKMMADQLKRMQSVGAVASPQQ